jgi:outer membrane protein assembly factor BamB
MRWHSRSSVADRIGDFWDALVLDMPEDERARLASQVHQELIESISDVRSLDDARLPSADFMARFEAHLSTLVEPAQKPRQSMNGRVHSLPVTPLPPVRDEGVRAPLAFPRSRRTFLYGLAAAAVLVALLASAYIAWTLRDERSSTADQNVIPAPTSTIDVPMDRGNAQRTGVMPGPGIGANPDVQWNLEAGQGGLSAAAVAGDTIYVANGYMINVDIENPGSIIAVDRRTGTERWRFSTDSGAGSTPAVGNGTVYAGDGSGTLYAIDAENGEEIWRTSLEGGWIAPPAIVDDTIYVATSPFRVSMQVAVSNGKVIVGSGLINNGSDQVKLYALDPTSGVVRWSFTDFPEATAGVYGFDAGTGELSWQFPMQSLESGPATDGQIVYAGSSVEGKIYALDVINGNEQWNTVIGDDLPAYTSPALVNGQVIVNTRFGETLALDAASGDELWRQAAQHVSFLNSPIVSGHEVLVVDVEGGISAYSIDDGTVLWTAEFDATGQAEPSPVIAHGILYLGTSLTGESGHVARLWALSGPSGPDDPKMDTS